MNKTCLNSILNSTMDKILTIMDKILTIFSKTVSVKVCFHVWNSSCGEDNAPCFPRPPHSHISDSANHRSYGGKNFYRKIYASGQSSGLTTWHRWVPSCSQKFIVVGVGIPSNASFSDWKIPNFALS